MEIYSSDGVLLLEVEVDSNSYRQRILMGEHNLTIYFSLAEHVELPLGCYVDYQNMRYFLMRPEALVMKHSRSFDYTIQFESYQSWAKRWKFRERVDGRLKFPLTATPREHLDLFVWNMNRRDSGWEIGECIESEEHLISYDFDYCFGALEKIAKEFDTEWEIEGKRVSLRKVEYNKDAPLWLSYGKGNGFKGGIKRSNKGDDLPVEILYTQGGERNIDAGKYGSSILLLPRGGEIGFDGVHFEDEEGYDSENARHYVCSEDGRSMQRSDKALSSMAEDSLDCTDVYPKRVGEVTSVIVADAQRNLYEFVDNTIPSGLDYTNYLIAGEKMTLIFQSGMLAGKEFDVQYIHNSRTEIGETKQGRRFRIVPQEFDGITMPNDSFKPVVGNKYAVFHCTLPDAYISDLDTKSGAEWEMFRKGVKYMYENEGEKFTFTGDLDGIWAKRDWANIGGKIKLGGYVRFTDARFQVDPVLIRITGIKDYLRNPHSPEITLSNDVVVGGFRSEFKKVESDVEVLPEYHYTRGEEYTKRSFRDASETMEMLKSAMFDGFTSAVNPITIQTMQALVGDESLQYRFVDSVENQNVVNPYFHWDRESGKFKIEFALDYYLQHLSLGVDMKNTHTASDYKWWGVGAYWESAVLDDGGKNYYLYLRCSEASGAGGSSEYRLSETPIRMDSEEGYYYFLVGVLNSEYEESRSFSTLYGFTEIMGGRITTNKIVSNDGRTYFDLENNEMGGKIYFKDGLISGDIAVKNDSGQGTNAGLSGRGTDGTSVRIWAGADTADKDTAPFRVLDNGSLFANNAELSGVLKNCDYLKMRPRRQYIDNDSVSPDLINYDYVEIDVTYKSILTYNESILDWSSSSYGRTIIIENVSDYGPTYNEAHKIIINNTRPDDVPGSVYWFLENGYRTKKIVIRENERVKLFFDGVTWDILDRVFVSRYDYAMGRNFRALAMGVIDGVNGAFSHYETFNGASITLTKPGTGHYRITIPNTWGKMINNCELMQATVYGGIPYCYVVNCYKSGDYTFDFYCKLLNGGAGTDADAPIYFLLANTRDWFLG